MNKIKLRNVAAVLTIFLTAAAMPTSAQEMSEQISACRETPTATCLADIGVALFVGETDHPRVTQSPELLAQMQRFPQALELARHLQSLNGDADEKAKVEAAKRLAPFVLIDRLQMGESLDTAAIGYSQDTILEGLSRMSGAWVSGTSLGLPNTANQRVRDILFEYASQNSLSKEAQLQVIELMIEAEDTPTALALLAKLDGSDVPHMRLSQRVIRLIGTDRALEIYRDAGAVRPFAYFTLAEAETDPTKVLPLLDVWLESTQENESGIEVYNAQRGIVRIAARHNHMALAKRIARDIERAMRSDASRQPLDIALVQLKNAIDLNSGWPDVRRIMRHTERVLEDVSDGYRKDTVLRELAMRYAAQGDPTSAARLVPPGEWEWLLGAVMPWNTRVALWRVAKQRLSSQEFHTTQAKIAARHASPKSPPQLREFARELVMAALNAPPPTESYQRALYFDNILRAAHLLGETSVVNAALLRSAETALEFQESRAVLQAAYQFYRLSSTEPN